MRQTIKLAIVAVIALLSFSTANAQEEPFIGEVKIFAGQYAPEGWAFCDGQILSASSHRVLHFLLGTTYGGSEEKRTFALPDLRGRTPVHVGKEGKHGQFELGSKVSANVNVDPRGRGAAERQPEWIQPSLGMNYIICLKGAFPGKEKKLNGHSFGMAGEVRMFAGNYAPAGWKLCDGDSVRSELYPSLHASLGVIDGGKPTFELPDFRGRMPVHVRELKKLRALTNGKRVDVSTTESNNRKIQPTLGLNYIIAMTGMKRGQQGVPMLGEVRMFVGVPKRTQWRDVTVIDPPMGWKPCDGQILNINSNQTLYSLIGPAYGGSAEKKTFALPDLRGGGTLAHKGQGKGLNPVEFGKADRPTSVYVAKTLFGSNLEDAMAGKENNYAKTNSTIGVSYMVATEGLWPLRN